MVLPFQEQVWSPLTQRRGIFNPAISRGSLVNFNYLFYKTGHDPSPLVLITDVWPQYIRGINLHYLTFPVIRKMLYPAPGTTVCDNPIFTYQYLKNNPNAGAYILTAFRQYKLTGIDSLKKLDCEFVANALAISRSFDPNEIEAIRQSVREQINRLMNAPAQASPEVPFSGNIPQ